MQSSRLNTIESYSKLCDEAEKQLISFTKEIQLLKSLDENVSNQLKATEEFSNIKASVIKLKYQLNQLSKTLDDSNQLSTKYTPNIKFILDEIFVKLIQDAFPFLPYDITTTANIQACGAQQASFSDYQCNAAMTLFKKIKEYSSSSTNNTGNDHIAKLNSPESIAKCIVSQIDLSFGSAVSDPKTLKTADQNGIREMFASIIAEPVVVTKPGFINISLSRSLVTQIITQFILHGHVNPINTGSYKYKVIVDLSSPNIAKEMHVGHLRSTIIGDSICRLFEFLGHPTLRINHVGDWGTQFGMLIAHLQDVFPNYLTASAAIGDLQKFYRESKVRFDEDPVFKKRAYENVVKLQSKDPNIIAAWQLICQESFKEFQIIYDLLDVDLVTRGESFYQDMMVDVIQELQKQGRLVNEDGRLVMFVEGYEVPLIMQKSDGGFTYDTSDIASIRHRINVEKGERLIYVVDSGQGLHFNQLFQACRQLGWGGPNIRLEHAAFGVVLGEDKKKFKTRSGDTIRLQDLIAEGMRRTEAKLREKGRDTVLTPEEFNRAKETVALSCIKYADLSNNRTKDYVFSFDKMLDDKGNTAAYLLYAYTRIRSIGRLAGYDRNVLRYILSQYCKIQHSKDQKMFFYPNSTDTMENNLLANTFEINTQDPNIAKLLENSSNFDGFAFAHEKEYKLVKCLCRTGEVLAQIFETLLIHTLCDYLYEIACTFTEFYDNCYCVEKDKASGKIIKVNIERLLICEATAIVMELCFHLLGIKPVEKM